MADILLKRTAADLLETLKPLGKALVEVQSDTCFIGECYQIWYNLRNKTPKQFAEITRKRYEKAVKENPVIFAANLLDHPFTGNNLDTEDVSNALNYIKDVDEKIVPEVMKFMSKARRYNAAYFEGTFKDADPVSWWKSGVKMGFDEKLQFRWCLPFPPQEAWNTVSLRWELLKESCGHRGASRRPVNWRLCTAK